MNSSYLVIVVLVASWSLFCLANIQVGSGPLTLQSIAIPFKSIRNAQDKLSEIQRFHGDKDSHMFKWLPTGLSTLKSSGRGIVISTGSRYFALTVHTIKTLRLLGCKLPVEVFYIGEADLPAEKRALLETMDNVQGRNLLDFFDDKHLRLEGFYSKPFAALASSFQEVILMDADCVFVQKPEKIFDDPGYVADGSLSFKDRTLAGGVQKNLNFVNNLFDGNVPESIKALRYYRLESNYEQESGVVAIDKGRHLAGLLVVCQLNAPIERKILGENIHGDKETFFLGFALAGESFYFNPSMAANIGPAAIATYASESVFPVGHLAHLDREGRLFWFNDGIIENKRGTDEQRTRKFDASFIAREGKWTLPTDYIITSASEEISPDLASFLDESFELYDPNL